MAFPKYGPLTDHSAGLQRIVRKAKLTVKCIVLSKVAKVTRSLSVRESCKHNHNHNHKFGTGKTCRKNESNRSRNGVYDICKVKATVLS
jgi:hypothetical protein